MKKFVQKLNNKWVIQGFIAAVIIYICIEPRIYLHPVMAGSMVIFCYILHSYIENLYTLNLLKQKQELIKNEQQLNAILNCIPMAIFLKDLSGNVLFTNKMAHKCFGESYNIVREVYQHGELTEEDKKIKNTLCCIQKEVNVSTLKGTKKWFNLIKCPIINSENELIGICAVMRDVDIEKIAEEQKETFVATLTHDLKTPTLAQIKAIDLVLDDNNMSEEQTELLKMTKESCKYMLDMISTLLCTYKYENGDFALETELCDIKKLAQEVCTESASLLKENNNTVEILADGEVITICDRMQIKRVITNFLSNAISYAYKNSEIKIKVYKKNKWVKVKIISSSNYIEPQTLENLFKKYVTHAAKYNKIGVGLGLYLSKQIINAHGGEVYAKSYEANKNIFGFNIPERL